MLVQLGASSAFTTSRLLYTLDNIDIDNMFTRTCTCARACVHVVVHMELKMVDNPVISVTVNNGSASSTNQQVRSGRQLVMITPLPPGYRPPYVTAQAQSTTLHSNPSLTVGPTTRASIGVQSQGQKRCIDSKLDKVLLKAACKGKQKEFKTFTLRSVDTAAVVSSQDLKKLIKESLHDDSCSRDFDTGHMQGSNVIRLRTKEDMSEILSEVKKQGMLWCDGLVDTGSKASKSGCKHVSDEDLDDEPSVTQPKKKKKKVDNEAIKSKKSLMI